MISLALAALSLSFQPAPAAKLHEAPACTAASSKGSACAMPTPAAHAHSSRDARLARAACNPDPTKGRACHHAKIAATQRLAETPTRATLLAGN